MKNNIFHVLIICVLTVQWVSVSVTARSSLSLFEVDLRTGRSSPLPDGITWHSSLTASRGGCACDRQGVLKLNFSPARRRVRVQLNLTFEHSKGFTFNVGDSVTNNGYAGDSNSQKNDAEVHSGGNTILFYGRDNPAGGSYGLLHKEANFVGINPYTTVTLNVADELVTADNGRSYLYINSHKMFALNGQADSGGVNRDVYLAMNRVVAGSYRSGTGLCKVTAQFFPKSL